MQKYFVNSLVGFLVVVAIFPTTPAREISLFDTLAKVTQVDDLHTMVETNIDPANSILVNEQSEKHVTISPVKKYVPKKFIKVSWEVPQDGVTLVEGESYELTCIIDARPQGTVYWFRGENPQKKIDDLKSRSVSSAVSDLDEANIVRIRSKYLINCATKNDQGPIHCVAIADNNRISQKSTIITVKDSNEGTRTCSPNRAPVITKHTSVSFSYVRSTVVLPCEAEGVPRPTTRWVDLQGTEIINHRYSDRFKVLGTGELLIENLDFDDMGGFTCIAESSSGVDQAEVFLYPMEHEN